MASKASSKKVTIKVSPKSNSASSGFVPCNICKGTGRLPKGYNKGKK